MDNQLQEEIADEMSLKARRRVLQILSSGITTEDLEMIAAKNPLALDIALHNILNYDEEQS